MSQQPRQQVKKVDWGLVRVGGHLDCWAGLPQLPHRGQLEDGGRREWVLQGQRGPCGAGGQNE